MNILKLIWDIVVVVICVLLVAKCIYKLLGYGTPINTTYTILYAVTLIVLTVCLPVYIYQSFFKKGEQ